jgi:hypothetical protein
MGLSSELKRRGQLPGQGKAKGEPTVSQAAKSGMKKQTGPQIDAKATDIPAKVIRGATAQTTSEQRSQQPMQQVVGVVTSAQAARGARQEFKALEAVEKADRTLSRTNTRQNFAPGDGSARKRTRTRAEPAVEIPVPPTPDSQRDVTPPPVADPRPEPSRENAYQPSDTGGGSGGGYADEGNSNFLPTAYDDDTPTPANPEEALPPGQEPGTSGSAGFGVIGIIFLGAFVWLVMRNEPGGDAPGKLNGLPLPDAVDDDEEVDVTPESNPYSHIVVDKKLRASRAA